MNDLILTLDEQKKLEELGINAVILFGSHAQNVATDKSDIDIAILMSPGPSGKTAKKQIYDELYTIISDKVHKLINIDIVFLETAPMELQSHVAKYGRVLFQKNESVIPHYKEHVMRVYADFAPLRRMFQQATLDRIP